MSFGCVAECHFPEWKVAEWQSCGRLLRNDLHSSRSTLDFKNSEIFCIIDRMRHIEKIFFNGEPFRILTSGLNLYQQAE